MDFLWLDKYHPLDRNGVLCPESACEGFMEPWAYYSGLGLSQWSRWGIVKQNPGYMKRLQLYVKSRLTDVYPIERNPVSVPNVPKNAIREWEELVRQFARERQRVYDPKYDSGVPAPALPIGTMYRLPDTCPHQTSLKRLLCNKNMLLVKRIKAIGTEIVACE
jgi:hypothetical protein